jgi:hypothetical protein
MIKGQRGAQWYELTRRREEERELERRATDLLKRDADRRREATMPPPRSQNSIAVPQEPRANGWVALSDLKRALRSKANGHG